MGWNHQPDVYLEVLVGYRMHQTLTVETNMKHIWNTQKDHQVVVSNVFYFHPYLGRWSNLTNIFQRGWNHQLDFEILFQSHYFRVYIRYAGPNVVLPAATVFFMACEVRP